MAEAPDNHHNADDTQALPSRTPARRPLFDAGRMGAAPAWLRPTPNRNAPPNPTVDEHADEQFEHTAYIPPIPRPDRSRAEAPTEPIVSSPRVEDQLGDQPVAPAAAALTRPPAFSPCVPLSQGERAWATKPEEGEQVTLDQDEVRVPVAEEQLRVEKRPVARGEVLIDRRVEERVKTIAVEVQREALRVFRRPIEPARVVDARTAFVEQSTTIPVFGMQACARKETVITGELVIHRRIERDRSLVQDTVRREVVTVDDDYAAARAAFRADFARRHGVASPEAVEEDPDATREFQAAEMSFRRGFTAAREKRFAGRNFEQAEPDLRREYEHALPSSATTSSGASDATPGAAVTGARGWRQVLEDVRLGWQRARAQARDQTPPT